MRNLTAFAVVSLLMLANGAPAAAQSGENVVVVANQANAASVQIAERYAQVRGLPAANVIRLNALVAEPSDSISRLAYERFIERPIADWFARHSAQDRILYIVLTKGIPLRIDGTAGRNGLQSSVDSELTLLYRGLTGRPVPPQGRIPNPYFAGENPAALKFFTHREHDIFLVTRLDGFTVSDALQLIDRGIAPGRDGRVLLDQKAALDNPGNGWLERAAEQLRAGGFAERVVLERTSTVLMNVDQVLGYYSWGSGDPGIRARRLGIEFAPGALAATFVSGDGRTFREPPNDWVPGAGESRKTYHAGSQQSLAGDLLREGATGVGAHVAEPYLDASIRPDILFPAYFAGFNLAEAFYLATPYLSWQTIVLGDPLCAPFRAAEPAATDIQPSLDNATELTAFFSSRRLEQLQLKAMKREALELLLRGEARLARGDRDAGREALEAATATEERLTRAHMLLATLYQDAGDYDRAVERYRRVLEQTPQDVPALNNLAYTLAVHKARPADALPVAQKARLLAPANPEVADTLGWVHHLLGQRAPALRFLTQALRAAPENPEFIVHMASAYAAAGQLEAAERELNRALTLQMSLGQRADVQALQSVIGQSRR